MIRSIVDTDIQSVPGRWPMPEALRSEVADYWAKVTQSNPHLWNGRILGVVAPGQAGGLRIEGGVLRGVAMEDDYAAFTLWRDRGFPPIGICNLFGAAPILSNDGALIFGIMGSHTAAAGQVYPPAGSLEPRDIDATGRVDVFGSAALELREETGLSHHEARVHGQFALFDGQRVCLIRVLRFEQSAADLLARIRGNLEAQAHRELLDVVAIRSHADIAAAGPSPSYTRLVVDAVFGAAPE